MCITKQEKDKGVVVKWNTESKLVKEACERG